MLECLILGDSIAVGIGQHRPECLTIAETGISSTAFLAKHPGIHEANQVVISLGSNDGNPEIDALNRLRSTIKGRVYWILPKTPAGEFAVNLVATAWGDRVFAFRAGRDGVHPIDYRGLAERMR